MDNGYAPTWAMLGRAYTTNASVDFGGVDGYEKAFEAYQKSLALDPSQLACRVYMANLFTDTGRVERAVPLLKEVLAITPNFAEADWELSYAYRFGGLLQESVELAERARRLDPSVKRNSSAINAYLYLGDYNRFLTSLPQDETQAYVVFYRGFGEYHLGMKRAAERDFDRADQLDPSLLQTQVGEAISLSLKGEEDKGLKVLHGTESQIAQRGVYDPEAMYKVAEAYSILGDKPSALRLLRRSIENGFFCYAYFVRDPLLDPIRNTPGFSDLLEAARSRSVQFQRQFS